MRAPVVSVLMPVRDGERWLRDAIDSVLAQTFSDFELLAIDDGSTDNTPNTLADYRARDPRVIVVRQERLGLAYALNRGLAEAKGSLIARLDADDVALPERLQRQVRYFDKHPDVALLGTWAQVIDDTGQPMRRRLRPLTDPKSLAATLARTNPFVHSSVMFPAATARDLGGYRPIFEAAEDYDLWLRFSEAGGLATIPEMLILYRRHGGNVTTTSAVRQVFSARLARESSEARRKTGRDPASSIAAPPDWHTAEANAFYADAARLCRVLELADPEVTHRIDPSSVDLGFVSARISNLTPAERKLAQRALVNLIRQRIRVPHYTTSTLFALLFRLHPMRALSLLWRA